MTIVDPLAELYGEKTNFNGSCIHKFEYVVVLKWLPGTPTDDVLSETFELFFHINHVLQEHSYHAFMQVDL